MVEKVFKMYQPRGGKGYAQYMGFIGAVKSGKNAIAYGKEYVVLSKTAYDELIAALRKANAELQRLQIEATRYRSWNGKVEKV